MKPYLERPVTSLKGVGPKRAAQLKKLGAEKVGDLLTIFPRRYEDRRLITPISGLEPGAPATVRAFVSDVSERTMFGKGRRIAECTLSDGSGVVRSVWFNVWNLASRLKDGAEALFYGVPDIRGTSLQFVNPDFCLVSDKNISDFARIVPIYPSTEGLSEKWYSNLAAEVLRTGLAEVEETLPMPVLEKRGLMGLADAISEMHRPSTFKSRKEARRRLAYGELFRFQLKLALRREKFKRRSRHFKATDKSPLYSRFRSSLPFELTDSQENALREIFADMSASEPMSRLLQGDVGSGKTLVALGAAAAVADAGAQTVMMAPTEVLARQLYGESVKYLAPLGVKCVFLSGNLGAREKRDVLASAADGSASVIAGTQALIEEGVSFKDLGLAVIDEQHRFGVGQRSVLMDRMPAPDVLMMSATPIPRTLTLTVFGDLDISELREKPSGRRKVETRLIDGGKLRLLLSFIVKEAKAGGRTYWVCPRIEEEGVAEIASAEQRYGFLQKHLGPLGVGLLHGRMNGEEKEAAIAGFRNGETNILVSTTVVEVGIDVPEASVMVIESPERFGLAQLHQLRGRVGRGNRRGVCVMLSNGVAESERLGVMLETDDGFAIAEADLKMRGAGELAGRMQHGMSDFKVADLFGDSDLLFMAREDAKEFAALSQNTKHG